MTDEPVAKLREWQSKREKGGSHYTKSIRFDRIESIPWSRGLSLPVRDRDLQTFRVHCRSAKAIVVPDPVASELRIPYIVRYYPGDMKALLDELVAEAGHARIRFVNLSPDGTASQISDVLGVPEPQDLREAVHGFEEVTEHWEAVDGEDTEPVACLVGKWTPGEVDDDE